MSTSASRKSKKTRASIIGLIAVVAVVAIALIAGGIARNRQEAAESSADGKTTIVKVAYATSEDDPLWAEVNKVLAKRGKNIKVKTVAFEGGSDVATQAAVNGEIDILSNGHKAFYKNLIATKHYPITSIGDTVIVTFNLYSTKYKSVKDLPDGARIAVPNNTTNAARAYQVLEQAGLITLDPSKKELPTKQDIIDNPKHLIIDEVDSNQIPNLLGDYDAGATNAFAAISFGWKPNQNAIYTPSLDLSDPNNAQWVNVLEVRSDRKNDPTLKAVASAYRSKEVAAVINKIYDGAKKPVF